MIEKGNFQREVREIYNTTDKTFISEQSNEEARTEDGMVMYVYRDDKTSEAIGYLCVYERPDFIEMEEFPVHLKRIKKNSVYIWEVCTKKGHEGRGIASALLSFVLSEYPNCDVYSCIDDKNAASLKIHERAGFLVLASFKANYFKRGEDNYYVLKLSRQSRRAGL